MDYIDRQSFVRFDSTKMVFATLGWTFGPYLGIWLNGNFGPAVAYGFSMFWLAVLLVTFWYLRLSDSPVIQPAARPPANPIKHIGRFISQPRLRLAWFIAFSRSAFWMTLFVFGPILMVDSGMGAEAGGLLLSIANFLLVTCYFWGRAAERRGVRPIIVTAFLGTAVALVVAGIGGEYSVWLAAGSLLVAAFFCSSLDAVGGVPFYRSVKRRERAQMTAVYRSYIDLGDLMPSLVYTVLLGVLGFGLEAVFIALACLHVVCALVVWRYLPRSM
ncbi:MAG: MFS transporter [Hyphomicrobiaceae bacterium]